MCDSSRLSDSVAKLVAEDARRGGWLAELTGPTGKHECVTDLVFLGVEHVRANKGRVLV